MLVALATLTAIALVANPQLPLPSRLLGFFVATLALTSLPFGFHSIAMLGLLQLPLFPPLFQLSDATIRGEDAVLGAVVLRALIVVVFGRRSDRWDRTDLAIPLVLLAFLLWLGTTVSISPFSGEQRLSMFIAVGKFAEYLVAAVVLGTFLSAQEIVGTINWWIWFALAQSLLASARLLPFIVVRSDPIGAVASQFGIAYLFEGRNQLLANLYGDVPRMTGTFVDPAAFGHFVLLGLLATIASIMAAGLTRARAATVVILIVGVAGSLTRTTALGLVTSAVAIVIFVILQRRSKSPYRLVIYGGGGILVILVLTLVARPLGSGGVEGIVLEESVAGRIQVAVDELRVWLMHPLAGVGWSGERFARPADAPPWANVVYLRLLAETGAVGLALYCSALVLVFRRAGAALARGPAGLALWITLSVGAYVGLGFGDFTLGSGAHVTYWQLLILAMGSRLGREGLLA